MGNATAEFDDDSEVLVVVKAKAKNKKTYTVKLKMAYGVLISGDLLSREVRASFLIGRAQSDLRLDLPLKGTAGDLFHIRTLNCLAAAEIGSLRQLKSMRRTDLMQIPNFGKACLRDVEEVLASFGLTLRN